jgi:hypothetical protein
VKYCIIRKVLFKWPGKKSRIVWSHVLCEHEGLTVAAKPQPDAADSFRADAAFWSHYCESFLSRKTTTSIRFLKWSVLRSKHHHTAPAYATLIASKHTNHK